MTENGISPGEQQLPPGYWSATKLAKWIIAIPMLAITVYYTLVAENRYVSESKLVVVKNSEANANLTGIALPMLGFGGNASQEDTRYLKEYIYSPEMFDILDKQLNLRKNFEPNGLDVFYMIPGWASKEYAIEYFRNRLDLLIDDRTGILTVRTQGFTPEFSLRFNQAILKESERFINELSYKIAREQLDLAGQEVSRARKGLDSVKESLLPFQEKQIDPVSAVSMSNQIVSGLESTLAGKEAELRAALGMLQDSAPQVVALRQAISALKEQIRTEKSKLSSTDGGRLNRRAAEYANQKTMLDFQADLYKVALSAFEKTRVDTIRKIKSLAVISSPNLPERAEYPRRLYSLFAAFFLLVMAYGFLRLGLAVIEDHRD